MGFCLLNSPEYSLYLSFHYRRFNIVLLKYIRPHLQMTSSGLEKMLLYNLFKSFSIHLQVCKLWIPAISRHECIPIVSEMVPLCLQSIHVFQTKGISNFSVSDHRTVLQFSSVFLESLGFWVSESCPHMASWSFRLHLWIAQRTVSTESHFWIFSWCSDFHDRTMSIFKAVLSYDPKITANEYWFQSFPLHRDLLRFLWIFW